MTTAQITERDIEALRYFWEEKGDAKRWIHYEKKRPALMAEYPEIVKAIEDYETAGRTLTAVLKGVSA